MYIVGNGPCTHFKYGWFNIVIVFIDHDRWAIIAVVLIIEQAYMSHNIVHVLHW